MPDTEPNDSVTALSVCVEDIDAARLVDPRLSPPTMRTSSPHIRQADRIVGRQSNRPEGLELRHGQGKNVVRGVQRVHALAVQGRKLRRRQRGKSGACIDDRDGVARRCGRAACGQAAACAAVRFECVITRIDHIDAFRRQRSDVGGRQCRQRRTCIGDRNAVGRRGTARTSSRDELGLGHGEGDHIVRCVKQIDTLCARSASCVPESPRRSAADAKRNTHPRQSVRLRQMLELAERQVSALSVASMATTP